MERQGTKRSGQFVCTTCETSFTRREHLQRHVVMHGTDRPFACKFCCQNFGRRDVLKRHFHVCKARADSGLEMPILPQSTRGKKRTACVRCGSRKIACSSTFPCTACARSNHRCEYPSAKPKEPKAARQKQVRSENITEHVPHGDEAESQRENGAANVSLNNVGESNADFESESAFSFGTYFAIDHCCDQITPCTLADPRFHIMGTGLAFNFLRRSTQSLGLAGSFEVGTLEERQTILTGALGPPINFSTNQSLIWTDAYEDCQSWTYPTPVSNISVDQDAGLAATPTLDGDFMSGLQHVTNSIVALLKDDTVNKPQGSKITMVWSKSAEASCYAFFSPQNLLQNLEFYWSCWHPNYPAIHKPSFAPTSSSPVLVAAMAIIGACLSPRSTDRASANLWFNGLEELAFRDAVLLDDSICIKNGISENRAAVCQRLEAVQAAYLVVLFQNWEGSKQSQRRVRHQGYATLVAAARGFGLCSVNRHHLAVHDFSEFCWPDFVLWETLVRTGAYIFLLEFAFVIFHNMPPRLTVPEMRLSLAAPEACFQAQSAEECFVLLNSWANDQPEQSHISIYKAIERLCNVEDIGDSRLQSFLGLSALNLFSIVSALHCIAFHLNHSIPSASQFTPIKRALSAWMYLWNQQSHARPSGYTVQDMWMRVGFMRHAAEYWLLTQTIVDRVLPLNTLDMSLGGGHWKGSMGLQADVVYDDHEMDSLKAFIDKFQAMTYLAI